MKSSNFTHLKRISSVFSIVYLLAVLNACAQQSNEHQPIVAQETIPVDKKKTIKIALLLDTSNSMDGLIEQAKSQLWTIVNELAKAKCDGIQPNLQIALYEYGNAGLSAENGYIRLVTDLTSDLDKLSHDLFSLKTNGGDEYCGYVIQTAINQLSWNQDGNDLQTIFIAGNEPFTQGRILYTSACSQAKAKKIVVNSIFCGGFNEGISSGWKNGADLTGGAYMSIEQNTRTVYINTPYDNEISALNDSLNNTYIAYGSKGIEKKRMQTTQDNNAEQYSSANKVNRAVTKSSHLYKNSSWDLVDAHKEKTIEVDKISTSELPVEMRNMDVNKRKEYIHQKSLEREKITHRINELNKQRLTFIAKESNKQNTPSSTLDNVLIEAVKKQAIALNFVFENN